MSTLKLWKSDALSAIESYKGVSTVTGLLLTQQCERLIWAVDALEKKDEAMNLIFREIILCATCNGHSMLYLGSPNLDVLKSAISITEQLK